jgi:hypothetical protein
VLNDAAWREARLAAIPHAWRGRVERQFTRRRRLADALAAGTGARGEAERAANVWLRGISERCERLRVRPTLSDDEILSLADNLAAQAFTVGEIAPGVFLTDKAAIRQRMASLPARYGIEAPGGHIEDEGAIRRMTDPHWWRRGLRRVQARALEGAAIALGFVHRNAEIYASTPTVERRGQQLRRNADALDGMDVVNMDTGEAFKLSEIAARSIANPKIRHGELMTRIAGFEAVAKGIGHCAEFVTLTCPSRFHAMRQVEGKAEANPNHTGETPREAQGYLSKIWQRIRAKLARMKAEIYGFRIAEPHHDGTPHWHMVLFMERSAAATVRAVIMDYALRDSGTEPGAATNRVQFVNIDPERGSAAGYVAKYISKNIEGGRYKVQGDLEGMDAVMPTNRVEAWASTWGIRQFQQIGGPPVGIWRELRRLDANGSYSATIEAARSAADCGQRGKDEAGTKGNWRRFVEIMGGPTVKRRNLPIVLSKTQPGERWDARRQLPYPANQTRYGEIAPGVIKGLVDAETGEVAFSRPNRWEIRAVRGAVRGEKTEILAPWIHVNNCTVLGENPNESETKLFGTGGGDTGDRQDGAGETGGGDVTRRGAGCAEGHRRFIGGSGGGDRHRKRGFRL